MPRKEPVPAAPISAQAQQDLVSEGIENFELPRSVVAKIAKSAIPENSKLQKETVLSLVKGSTVFINYLAATAHDVAVSKQHKSISASDVLKALEMIEFGDLVEKLQGELVVYRELAKTDKTKRGSSNINGGGSSSSSVSAAPSKPRTGAPPTPGTITISAPVPSTKPKEKEKEKERAFAHSPFTSTPLMQSYGPGDVGESVSVSMGSRMGMDVDWEEELGEKEGREGDVEEELGEKEGKEGDVEGEEGGQGVGDDEDEDEDVVDEVEDEGEGEELEEYDDPMEVEAEEMRRDERGLDDPHSEV